MRSKVLVLKLILAAVFSAGIVFAQTEPGQPLENLYPPIEKNDNSAEKKADKSKIDLSAVIFMEYSYDLDNNQKTDVTTHGFNITRTYLNAEKKINDNFKARLTLDSALAGKFEEQTYNVFVKFAYIDGFHEFNEKTKINFQAGLIGTPVVGLIDGLSDYRWIYNNYIDKSNDLGVDLKDSSADLGMSATFDLLKLVSVTGAYMNGEGFSKLGEDGANPPTEYKNSGKSFYGAVSFNPFKTKQGGKGKKDEGLYLNSFGKYEKIEIENKDAGALDKTNYYYGGGLAWFSAFIKTGAYYIICIDKSKTVKEKSTLLDSYVNVNLDTLIKMPVLVMGRFAMGDGNTKPASDEVKIFAGGAGYKFNDNFRILAYYQYTKQPLADEQAAYIKTETKF